MSLNPKLTNLFRKACILGGAGDIKAAHEAMDEYDKEAGFSSRRGQNKSDSSSSDDNKGQSGQQPK